MTVTRRALTFNTLDEVVADAENLLATGYERAGKWDLAQVCDHVAEWMRFPVQGFPKAFLPIRLILWMMKVTIGRKKFEGYLATKSFPAGKPTMPETVFKAGGDPLAAVAKLKQSVEALQNYKGEVHPSPLFGKMTYDECVRMQLVHCAHHLSFLVPISK